MPFFELENKKLNLVRPIDFKLEKELQDLIEKNLEIVFNCRFVATEFPTGPEHAGRIDTLALSEDNNPVIIEYKKVESSELVNQSLYYLSWIDDHHGDFTIAVQKALGNNVKIDWSDVRVICIAPGYKKYDLHAVQMMGANIELWQYRLFDNKTLYLEEVTHRNISLNKDIGGSISQKDPVMVAAGKKAAITRATGIYSFEEHLKVAEEEIKQIAFDIRDYCLELADSVEEIPKKYYIAYKVSQNFTCLMVKKTKVVLLLKIDSNKLEQMPVNARDISKIGHLGTGNFEVTIKNMHDFDEAKELIKMSFDNVGG